MYHYISSNMRFLVFPKGKKEQKTDAIPWDLVLQIKVKAGDKADEATKKRGFGWVTIEKFHVEAKPTPWEAIELVLFKLVNKIDLHDKWEQVDYNAPVLSHLELKQEDLVEPKAS